MAPIARARHQTCGLEPAFFVCLLYLFRMSRKYWLVNKKNAISYCRLKNYCIFSTTGIILQTILYTPYSFLWVTCRLASHKGSDLIDGYASVSQALGTCAITTADEYRHTQQRLIVSIKNLISHSGAEHCWKKTNTSSNMIGKERTCGQ